MNTNISYTYLSKRKYAEALQPGETALNYYQSIGQQYGLSIVEANLAEITFYLGRYAESRHYAESGLKRVEPWVRPYCLYVLGHLSRVEADFEAAEKYCHDAIQSAQEIEDPWAEAPARNGLGEVYRDAGRPEDALEAFQSALDIWKRIDIQHEVEHTEQLITSINS
ncbi:MAG: tetratricopeptide repeat protein [Chloroflexota bacterium]